MVRPLSIIELNGQSYDCLNHLSYDCLSRSNSPFLGVLHLRSPPIPGVRGCDTAHVMGVHHCSNRKAGLDPSSWEPLRLRSQEGYGSIFNTVIAAFWYFNRSEDFGRPLIAQHHKLRAPVPVLLFGELRSPPRALHVK